MNADARCILERTLAIVALLAEQITAGGQTVPRRFVEAALYQVLRNLEDLDRTTTT